MVEPLFGKAYTQTLNNFFSDWMSGLPLAQCITNASTYHFGAAPLRVPGKKVYIGKGVNP